MGNAAGLRRLQVVDHREQSGYHAYLLRCWQERRGPGQGAPVWRFSLEDPNTHTRHGFATFPELVAALLHDMDLTVESESSILEDSTPHPAPTT